MHEKLKSWLSDDLIFMALLVILTGLVSFYLGRASVGDGVGATPAMGQPASVVLTKSAVLNDIATVTVNNLAETAPQTTTGKDIIVASKSGTKYHLVTCGSAKAIKEENRIYFKSEAEATAAGYTRAANCSGW